MVDFSHRLYKDFEAGNIVFVIKDKEKIGEIEHTLTKIMADTEGATISYPVSVSTIKHPAIENGLLVGHKRAYPDWEWKTGILPRDSSVFRTVTIMPWETAMSMVDDLNNKSIDDIMHKFGAWECVISLTSFTGPSDKVYEAIAEVLSEVDDDACDVECTYDYVKKYIEAAACGDDEFGVDNYMYLSVGGEYGKGLDTWNGTAIGEGTCSYNASHPCDGVVYPISYLEEKILSTPPVYSNEDFASIF